MPTSPLRYCQGSPTCPNKVRSGRCPVHQTPTSGKGWHASPLAPKRISGRRLQRLRLDLFTREPFCRTCAAAGRMVLAEVRDHIIPLAEGGTDDDSNIAPICRACSDAKSQREAARGRLRGG